MRIGMVCYPTYGGSGILATELGHELAKRGHCVHFITYAQPMRLDRFQDNIYYHEVETPSYPLMEFNQYTLALAGKILDVAKYEQLDVVHVHYAIPHAISAYLAKEISQTNRPPKAGNNTTRNRYHTCWHGAYLSSNREVLTREVGHGYGSFWFFAKKDTSEFWQ